MTKPMIAIKITESNREAILSSPSYASAEDVDVMMEKSTDTDRFFLTNYREPGREVVEGAWATWPAHLFYRLFNVANPDKIYTEFVEITHA